MRFKAKNLVGDNLAAENAPFTFSQKEGGEEIRPAPFVYIPNLWDSIKCMLNQHNSYGIKRLHINNQLLGYVLKEWVPCLA